MATPEYPAAFDSLVALYQNDPTLRSRYMLAWLYLQDGQYLQGQNVIDGIPTLYTLDESETTEYQHMQTLYGMLSAAMPSGGIEALTAAQLTTLQSMADAHSGPASVYARNILIALDEADYHEQVLLPDMYKSVEAVEAYHALLNAEAPAMLEVFPNPGKDFVIVSYSFDTETQGAISIIDIKGQPVHNMSFSGKKDQVTIVTDAWTAGVYVINLTVDGKTLESVKFTLVK
jgi:hypothetical protein